MVKQYKKCIGDHFEIIRTGNTLSFLQNGQEIYSYTIVDNHAVLFGEVLMQDQGASIEELNFFSTGNIVPLQNIDYRYNIRGWLTEINKIDDGPFSTNSNDLFNFKINYNKVDESRSPALYNGNISETFWQTKNENKKVRGYSYNYDNLNRIISAFSFEGEDLSNLGISYYDADNITYDKNGNIQTLKRFGSLSGESSMFWDDLTYTYNDHQLIKVDDAFNTLSTEGFIDGYTGSADDYTYDVNGNMITDKNKDITEITYNHLNLPESITFSNSSLPNIDYIYDATGVKMKKIVIDVGINTTSYAGSFIYNDNSVDGETLQFISQPEGYIVPTVTAGEGSNKSVKGFDTSTGQTTYSNYAYVFQYKDHLGNVRLSYSDGNLDGAIDPTSEIIEESNYYPFGLKQKGYNNVITGGNATAQAFKYNGVELNESLGLNLYEMDLRLYDPAIGRFNGIDPVTHHSMGTSVAFDNNPIFWADPSGADAEADDFFASKGGRSGSLAPGDNSPSGAGASSGPRGDSSSSTNSSPPTDYTLGKDGTVYRADPHDGSENDSTDSLTSVKNGNKIENVRKGILEEGQNFKDENSQIPYGGLFQPTLEEIREFIVKLSEDLINKEIAGHGFLNASTGQKTLGFYKYNSNTSEFSESSLYYNNEIVPSLNSFAKFHWHSHLNNGSYINDPSKEYDIPAFNQRTDAGTQSMPSYIFNRNGSFQYDQNGLINN